MEEERRHRLQTEDWFSRFRTQVGDSRPRQRQEVRIGNLVFERCFCDNCGAPSGLVLKGTDVFLYRCDQCVFRCGHIPDALLAPEPLELGTHNMIPCS